MLLIVHMDNSQTGKREKGGGTLHPHVNCLPALSGGLPRRQEPSSGDETFISNRRQVNYVVECISVTVDLESFESKLVSLIML